jgi:hypothetical protein
MTEHEAGPREKCGGATPEHRTISDLFAELDERERDKVEAAIGRESWERIKAKILPGLEPREVK